MGEENVSNEEKGYGVLVDVIPSLPLDVVNLLKEVRFTFSNYKEGTNGKDMSNDADVLIKKYVGNEA